MKNRKNHLLAFAAACVLTGCCTVYGSAADEEETVYQSELMKPDHEEMGEEENFAQQYTLIIKDEENAVLTEATIYDNGFKYSYEYPGKYTMNSEGSAVVFEYASEGGSTEYNLGLEGTQIVSVTPCYVDDASNMKDIAGTYSGSDEEHGKMEMVIDEYGSVSVKCEKGDDFSGNVYSYSGQLIFYGYDMDFLKSIDWVLTLDGDTFSYVTLQSSIYSEYAGTYSIEGDLGTIEVTANEEGTVSFSVMIDGAEREMTGSLYVDEETKNVTGIFAQSEDGYAVSLDIKMLEEEQVLNYSGSYTVPLGAG